MVIRFKVCPVSISCLLRPNPWSCMKRAWRSCRSTPKTAAGNGATPLQRRTSTRTCCWSWSCSQTCFPKSSLTSATQVSAARHSQVTFSLPLALKTLVFSLPAAHLDDVFRTQDQGTPACNRTVSAADVVLYGVNIVLPLMTQDLLKVGTSILYRLICFSHVCGFNSGSAFQFPSLCNQYYKLITFICEIFPEKIPQLPEDLFKSLMFSLELGMTSYPSLPQSNVLINEADESPKLLISFILCQK